MSLDPSDQTPRRERGGTLAKIIIITLFAAMLAFGLIAAIGAWRLSNGPAEAIAAGAENLTILALGSAVCVLMIGLVLVVFYGLIRLAKRAWREG